MWDMSAYLWHICLIYILYNVHISAKLSRVKFRWHILMFCCCATNSFGAYRMCRVEPSTILSWRLPMSWYNREFVQTLANLDCPLALKVYHLNIFSTFPLCSLAHQSLRPHLLNWPIWDHPRHVHLTILTFVGMSVRELQNCISPSHRWQEILT